MKWGKSESVKVWSLLLCSWIVFSSVWYQQFSGAVLLPSVMVLLYHYLWSYSMKLTFKTFWSGPFLLLGAQHRGSLYSKGRKESQKAETESAVWSTCVFLEHFRQDVIEYCSLGFTWVFETRLSPTLLASPQAVHPSTCIMVIYIIAIVKHVCEILSK